MFAILAVGIGAGFSVDDILTTSSQLSTRPLSPTPSREITPPQRSGSSRTQEALPAKFLSPSHSLDDLTCSAEPANRIEFKGDNSGGESSQGSKKSKKICSSTKEFSNYHSILAK
ncbi:hypothetical protein DPMN_183978 [Dreissena polymorpha]|uniref:Uncharacterized protein n=1 Tax=Dreissena polymorpha TaxID=45954 RepID=A0A9D4DJF9_DREPO|nr:hypothetical protein DPMN_183978 [Dreissena polymorpha]